MTTVRINGADYIIEEGHTGDWHYRKWHSGRNECWASLYYANTAMTTAEGSGYYSAMKTIAFPTNFFSGSLTVNATAEMNGALGGFAISAANKTNITGYFWATRSVTKNVWLNIYAISR